MVACVAGWLVGLALVCAFLCVAECQRVLKDDGAIWVIG